MGSNNLLISEPPLQVLPSLAKKIGLNNALFLQQLHYWLLKSKHIHENKPWVYNSRKSWHEQFPFWCEKTIETIIGSLKNKKLIIQGNFNKAKFDRTRWWTINYNNDLLIFSRCPKLDNALCNSYTMDMEEVTQPIPETTQEITKELYVEKNLDNAQIKKDSKEVLAFLNEKTGRRYRDTDANLSFIVARIKSGVSTQRCKCVVAKKCRDWLTDEKMNKYLRPATIFNKTKFEQYLGELSYADES